MNSKKLYIAALIVYLAAVAFLCFSRPENLPEMDVKTFLGIPIDKVLHFIMFLPYPILAGLSFIGKQTRLPVSLLILALAIITGAGISYGTEAIQAQTGYRAYEISDFYADMTGIATGTLISVIYLIKTRLSK